MLQTENLISVGYVNYFIFIFLFDALILIIHQIYSKSAEITLEHLSFIDITLYCYISFVLTNKVADLDIRS